METKTETEQETKTETETEQEIKPEIKPEPISVATSIEDEKKEDFAVFFKRQAFLMDSSQVSAIGIGKLADLEGMENKLEGYERVKPEGLLFTSDGKYLSIGACGQKYPLFYFTNFKKICHLWTGAGVKNNDGYALYYQQGKPLLVVCRASADKSLFCAIAPRIEAE